MATSVTVNTITDASLGGLRTAFSNATSKLVFRRVGKVVARPEDFVKTVVTTISREGAVVTEYGQGQDHPVFSDQEYLQNVEEHYSKFYFFTTTTSLRDNDPHGNIGIYGASNNYAELDFLDKVTFRFLPRTGTQIVPREGDLVCGLANRPAPGRANPAFKVWFICSEQFFHAWTAVMYENHNALTKSFDDESQIRRHLMSGNRLCTNGFRKWVLGCQQSMVESDDAELSKRFYKMRTETAARERVHVYAALVMMLRYKELPGQSNIPNNLDKSPKMTRWDLPDGWVESVIKTYGLVSTPVEVVVDAMPRPMIPKGTHITIAIDDAGVDIQEESSESKTDNFPLLPSLLPHQAELVSKMKLPTPTPCSSPTTWSNIKTKKEALIAPQLSDVPPADDVNPKHIALVMEQVPTATREQVVDALKKKNGDIVDAIMELMI
jgi:hypothetical protein